jgi:hypothetical protein
MLTIEEQRIDSPNYDLALEDYVHALAEEVREERMPTAEACNRFDKTIELTADCNDDETRAYAA